MSNAKPALPRDMIYRMSCAAMLDVISRRPDMNDEDFRLYLGFVHDLVNDSKKAMELQLSENAGKSTD